MCSHSCTIYTVHAARMSRNMIRRSPLNMKALDYKSNFSTVQSKTFLWRYDIQRFPMPTGLSEAHWWKAGMLFLIETWTTEAGFWEWFSVGTTKVRNLILLLSHTNTQVRILSFLALQTCELSTIKSGKHKTDDECVKMCFLRVVKDSGLFYLYKSEVTRWLVKREPPL